MKTLSPCNGWHQIAFERDLVKTITPLQIGDKSLMAVRRNDRIAVYDAACPHRGAHLAFGGCLDGDAVICPFHGYRVGLGNAVGGQFVVSEYHTLCVGGCLFVLIPGGPDTGFDDYIAATDSNHFIVPGFEMRVRVDPRLVIENAFDSAHFRPVHQVQNDPRFKVSTDPSAAFTVEGEFVLPPSSWQRTTSANGVALVPFTARAFSPCLIVSQMGGEHPYRVITAATPNEGGTSIRLSIAVPPNADGSSPTEDLCRYLLKQSKSGIEADVLIWEHLVVSNRPQYADGDLVVLQFRKFCQQFDKPCAI